MLIIGQDKEVVVNIKMVQQLTIYDIEDGCRVLAWFGAGDENCVGIGDYKTRERAKKVLYEIAELYKAKCRKHIMPMN